MLRTMFKKTYTLIDTKYKGQPRKEPNIPKGLWRKCKKCGQTVYGEDVKENFYICPKCGGYFRVHAYRRIEMTADSDTFEEWNREMEFVNPLDFPDGGACHRGRIAGGFVCVFGRGQDAGGMCVSDADGEDQWGV